MRLPVLLLVAALASACVYKIDIQQGNYVTQDLADKVKPGMTKAEVRAILGTPLLADVFHGNRWDYYFRNEKNGKRLDEKRLTVLFKDDKVASITGEANPPPPPVVTAPQAPAAAPPPVAPPK